MNKKGFGGKKGRSGPPEGNTNSMKYKTPEERRALFDAAVAHLEQGLDKQSFEPCAWATFERYCAEYPDEFDADRIAQAIRKGRQIIEKMLMSAAIGKTKGNPATLIFLAKNKIGYRDRVQVMGDPDAPLAIADLNAEQAAEAYRNMMKGL